MKRFSSTTLNLVAAAFVASTAWAAGNLDLWSSGNRAYYDSQFAYGPLTIVPSKVGSGTEDRLVLDVSIKGSASEKNYLTFAENGQPTPTGALDVYSRSSQGDISEDPVAEMTIDEGTKRAIRGTLFGAEFNAPVLPAE